MTAAPALTACTAFSGLETTGAAGASGQGGAGQGGEGQAGAGQGGSGQAGDGGTGQGEENTQELCSDGKDDDGDGYIDCEDPGCCSLVDCSDEPESFCAQGSAGTGGSSGTGGSAGTGGSGAGAGGSAGKGGSAGSAGSAGQGGTGGQTSTCGDGKLQPGEECDGGGAKPPTCSNDCKFVCTGPDFVQNPVDKRCYHVGKTGLPWASARAACMALGPGFDLATPSTAAELSFVKTLDSNSLWLGGSDQRTEGTFVWVTGEPWTYPPKASPWAPAEPNDFQGGEDCVELSAPVGDLLNDVSCGLANRYACERPPPGSPLCRNGIKEAGEECDDGNISDSDGCSNSCVAQVCGNGALEGSEQCDDGNKVNTDDCANDCRLNCAGPGFTRDATTNRCYFFSGNDLNWSSAQQACYALGPGFDLAAPSTLSEIAFVTPLINENTWLGGSDQANEGVFTWSNGEPWNYKNNSPPWQGSSSSPIFDCVELDPQGEIDDASCSSPNAYLCERPPLDGPLCRNGIKEAGEECDDGNTANTDACTNTCKNAKCGDGYTRTGVEECDDGNAANTDACTNTCKKAKCGDGYLQPSNGEQCDDGNATNGDGCESDCKPKCGDGKIVAPEQCEDGNSVDTDACTNACLEATCGDGIVRTGVEECDDGDNSNTDACTNTCKNAKCGDGYTRTGVEECDDGNSINTDACVAGCKDATCGDGYVQTGVEQCDDGNATNGDGCETNCTLTP